MPHLSFVIIFHIFVIAMLYIDLHYVHSKSKAISFSEAIKMSLLWFSVAMIFNLIIFFSFDHKAGAEFFTAYILEKSLSVDNIFVMIMIFEYFKIPSQYQYRVLYYGIVGAIIMRALFIILGISLIHKFKWMIYVFGGILLYSAYGMYKEIDKPKNLHLEDNIVIKYISKHFKIAKDLKCESFFFKEKGRLILSPLLLALITIEMADIIFAVDSVPAVIAITDDVVVAYTSNIMAILGLRALYFALHSMKDRFEYLGHAIAIILGFVGVKMIISPFMHIPVFISLLFIVLALTLGITLSLKKTKNRTNTKAQKKKAKES